MKEELEIKYNYLKEYIESLESVVVAYSAGVDSTLLLYVAHQILRDNVLAVTAFSSLYPERDGALSKAFCKEHGIRQMVIEHNPFDVEGFCDNQKDRCYTCKKSLFNIFKDVAVKEGFKYVAEGSNIDDLGDYRPGLRAIQELDIVSPLREAGLTKKDIRAISKELGLTTWEKPSFACLASRVPYGNRITRENLSMISGGEELLAELGFKQYRVRIHDKLARIEILPEDFSRLMEEDIRIKIYTELKKLGFTYITLDILGFRSGSMNEVLDV